MQQENQNQNNANKEFSAANQDYSANYFDPNANNFDPNQTPNAAYSAEQTYADPNAANTMPPAYETDPSVNMDYTNQDFTAGQSYPDYSQTYPTQDYQTDFDSQSQPGDLSATPMDANAPATPDANSFKNRKTGNRVFLIGSIVLVVILIIATGVLVYLNATRNTPTVDNNQNNSQVGNNDNSSNQDNNDDDNSVNQPADNGINTGGPDTPASKAKKFNETASPKTWLRQKFTSPDVDADGNCLVATKCGDQADPDQDNMTNIEEYNYQADPLNADTDKDGFADGDELFVYYTDPLKADSDGDTFNDSAEIINCYDPINTATVKMSTQRQSQITSNLGLKLLKTVTANTLRAAGASQNDIDTKGFITVRCATPATNTSTGSSSTSTSTSTGSTPTSTSTSSSSTGSTSSSAI